MRARLQELQLALMLLTRLPAGRLRGAAPGLGGSAWAWPLAGLAVGGIAGLGFLGAQALGLSEALAALIALGLGILATGGMHEDGLADLADGSGGQSRARRLEIMRDSRIGSYGVLALILALGLRAAALVQIAGSMPVLPALIGLAMASRAGMALWARLLPPARGDGLGHGAAGIPAAGLAVALALGILGLAPLGLAGVTAMAAVLSGGAAVAVWARSRLGGQTGDVLGAAQLVGEICGLLALAAA